MRRGAIVTFTLPGTDGPIEHFGVVESFIEDSLMAVAVTKNGLVSVKLNKGEAHRFYRSIDGARLLRDLTGIKLEPKAIAPGASLPMGEDDQQMQDWNEEGSGVEDEEEDEEDYNVPGTFGGDEEDDEDEK